MKLLAIVALFAILAVQLSLSAPVPDDEKKEVAAAPAVSSEAPATPLVEVKTEGVIVDATPAAKVETTAPAEDKKT
ncbi:hypothetical protein K1T71_012382 [Dendrolimus kikuchii]|uniref:Uncharacterized protein n=1 Tax=Dendrolimus kikuchii TaxID=765133 RepID=A0ACC1CLD8_9NEOP|nr:hypothetical protein K1T71_012382 [Dendrolimus kikuchii]